MAAPPTGLARFLAELRRRRVIRAAVTYAVVAFVVVQVAELLLPALLIPDWGYRLVVALALLGFPITLALSWTLQADARGIRREDPPPRPEATPPPRPPASIAVLPFTNLSADPENEFFGDGLAEELLNVLARLPDLRVAARTSSFAFRDATADAREIGTRLGVATILEGSVRRANDRVRITAQLIDAADGYHLWSDTYDRHLEDIFAIQEDIARCIASALELRLGERGERALSSMPTGDPHAYEIYLRARRHLNQATRPGMAYAIRMFRRATEVDPGYAPAHSGLATALVFSYLWATPDRGHLEEAERAANRALELAPQLAEAHVASGQVLSLLRRFDDADAEFRRAIELDPGSFDAWYYFARTRLAEGRLEEAVQLMARAHAARPEDYQAPALQSMMLRGLGRAVEAAAASREALAVLDRHLELNPDDVRAVYFRAHALIELGQLDEGRQWSERARAMAPEDSSVLYNVACSYARLGDREQALDDLQRAIELGHLHRGWIENDPDWDAFREEPRFQELLQRLG